MSNYTITTDFGAKDSLPSSNDSKVVRGSEFTTEFTNIQTAIATKADTAGDTFTGVVNFSADVAVNTNTLFVDVSEAKVGIGTTSPAKPLHVNSGTTNVVARFESTDADARIELKDSASTSLNQISVSGDNLYFSTNATERMRIDATGRLLIGGTQVQSPSSIDNGIFIQSQTNNEVVGVNLYTNEASNNRRADFFLDDANGVYGMHSTASTGLADFVIKSSSNERFRVTNTGNVGIGSTSPDTLLHVHGAGSGSGTYGAQITIGKSNGCKISSTQESADDDVQGLAFFTKASNQLSDSAVERLRIDSSGNVGIGTTSPDSLMHLSANTGATLTLESTDTAIAVNEVIGEIDFYSNDASGIGAASRGSISLIAQDAAGAGSMLFKTSNASTASTEHMRIDSSGNVGIGTTSPDSKLDVSGVIKAGDGTATDGGTALSVRYVTGHTLNNFGAMYSSANTLIGYAVESHKTQANKFISTASNSNFARGALTVDNELKFFSAGAQTTAVGSEVTMTERLRIDASGNVGIGTDSPAFKLDVAGNARASYFALRSNETVPSESSFIYRPDTGVLGFGTGTEERMRIDSSGNLLVGTTGATPNAKLKVNGAVILNANTIYSKSYSTLDTTGDVVAKATGSSNGSSTTFIFTGQGGSGAPFHIVFSCINAGGQWSATRSEIAASASVDVVASTSGNDVLFTFKSKSGSQGYSPRVRIETIGNSYDTAYLAA